MIRSAPGARAVIRDEEWLIRRADPSTDGGWLLTCDGISDLGRGQSALFLTALEGEIEILDPATTVLSHCLQAAAFRPADVAPPLCRTELSCQRVKLIGKRHLFAT